MSSITGILLAAGASRRFGADKLTQSLPNGDLVAVRACRNLSAGTERVLTVIRPGCDMLGSLLAAEGAEVLICDDAELGMGVSLAYAIRACSNAAGYVIALADMPWIQPATIQKVAKAIRTGSLLAAPCWQGRRGHPVGFSSSLRSELSILHGDSGAKNVIQAHRQQLQLIDCDDAGVLSDIDTPDDLNHPKPSDL
ncbi:MAG: nucleotidyltransferase family protein [Methylomonas lenta]|nr:nucleotidyltransferase family protein [Methylomonas lenta]